MNVKPPRFVLEQLALCPKDPARARKLLSDLGLDMWVVDNVHAQGRVNGIVGENHALLQFNYQSNVKQIGKDDKENDTTTLGVPVNLELELLHYTSGRNWMQGRENSASHIGMHCTLEQLDQFREYFAQEGIPVAQEVITQGHTNATIRDNRRYNYVIFATRDIIGVDLKFIVRLAYCGATEAEAICQATNAKTRVEVLDKTVQEQIKNNFDLVRQNNSLKEHNNHLVKESIETEKKLASAKTQIARLKKGLPKK